MTSPVPIVVPVRLGPRSYEIRIGSGVLEGVAEFLQSKCAATQVVIIADRNVREPYAASVFHDIQSRGVACEILEVPSGESSKSIDMAGDLWEQLCAWGAERHVVVAGIGGGVVGDLAGFVAASYARGTRFVQIPTTLLAQVDSSVGGKVGVNLSTAKNMVGAFWQPAAVFIDLSVLSTLPEREFRSGLAEIVKYGMILDGPLFEYLEQNTADILAREDAHLQHLIRRSCELKAIVVEEDEREESGRRAILNYGHTFAHAIEAVSGYGHWLHGEAVSLGMVVAARLAERLGRIPADVVQRQHALLTNLKLPVEKEDLPFDKILAAMRRDKKAAGGQLRFILPNRIGAVELVDQVPIEKVREAWEQA